MTALIPVIFGVVHDNLPFPYLLRCLHLQFLEGVLFLLRFSQAPNERAGLDREFLVSRTEDIDAIGIDHENDPDRTISSSPAIVYFVDSNSQTGKTAPIQTTSRADT